MIELYTSLNPDIIIFLLMLSIVGIIFEALYYLNLTGTKLQKFFEILLGLHIVIMAMRLRYIAENIGYSTIIVKDFSYIRYILAFGLLLTGIIISCRTRLIHVFLGVILVLLTLPFMENLLPYGYYSGIFIFSLLFYILRAGLHLFKELKKKKQEITKHSIKESLDTQHTGVLFAEEDGNILLINKQMHFLIEEITGKVTRNARNFWLKLNEIYNEDSSFLKKLTDTDGYIYSLKGQSWQLERVFIPYKKDMVYQITATDVTELELINKELEIYTRKLEEKRAELNATIDNLEELIGEEALNRAWSHLHGILGQHISFIQRFLNSNPLPDTLELLDMIDRMHDDITNIKEESPEKSYDSIKESFRSLGINLDIEGQLPSDDDIARVFVDIMREGISNALRHGEAKNIYIEMAEDEDFSINIKNDGKPSPRNLMWGGGFNDIDMWTRDRDGSFYILPVEEFTLAVHIPLDYNRP